VDVYKLEPDSCVDNHPVFLHSDDPLINIKDKELLIPAACSLLEKKVEVSYIFFFHKFYMLFLY
jgi:hypothetical protein